MKIELDLFTGEELSAFSKFMAEFAAFRERQEAALGVFPGDVSATVVEAEQKAAELAKSTAPAEEPKKPRGRPAKAVAEAKPAPEPEAAQAEPDPTKAVEPPALTFDEVRGTIIDLLNDWTAAKPDDPDVRKKVLSPLLDKLGYEKLSQIEPAKFEQALALVEESRAELAAYTGGNPEE